MVRYRLHDTSIFEYAVIAEPKLNASVHNAAYRGYTLPPPATRLLIASRFGPENIRYWDVMSTAARLSPPQKRLRPLRKIVAKCLKEQNGSGQRAMITVCDLLILNLSLQVFDGLFSYQLFSLGLGEANPLLAAAISEWSVVWGLLYNKLLACVLLIVIFAIYAE